MKTLVTIDWLCSLWLNIMFKDFNLNGACGVVLMKTRNNSQEKLRFFFVQLSEEVRVTVAQWFKFMCAVYFKRIISTWMNFYILLVLFWLDVWGWRKWEFYYFWDFCVKDFTICGKICVKSGFNKKLHSDLFLIKMKNWAKISHLWTAKSI